MATLTDKFKSLFQWFAEYDDDSVVHRLVEGGGTRGHIIRGFLKAFLVYLVPMTVLGQTGYFPQRQTLIGPWSICEWS